MKLTPRLIGLITAVAVALAALIAGASSAATARTHTGSVPSTLRIGYQAIPDNDLVVKDKKWLEQALPGTKIKWIEFQSGGDVNTAIVAGSIDIGLAGSSPVTEGLSKPLNIQYEVPWIFDVIGSAEALVVRSSAGIANIDGLVGKTIATPFASTSHFSLLAALTDAGVNPSKVHIVDMEPQDILAAWQRGDIDGAYVWNPTLSSLQKNGKTLITSATLAKRGQATADLAVVRTAFAQQYPDVLKTWVEEHDRAVKLYETNPTAAASAIAKELDISTSDALAQAKQLVWLDAKQQASPTYLGTPGEPGAFAQNLLASAKFLKGQDKIDAVPTLASLQKALANTAVSEVANG